MEDTTRQRLKKVVEAVRLLDHQIGSDFLNAWRSAIVAICRDIGPAATSEILGLESGLLGRWAATNGESLRRLRNDGDPDIAVLLNARRLSLAHMVEALDKRELGIVTTQGPITPPHNGAVAVLEKPAVATATEQLPATDTTQRRCKHCLKPVSIPAGASGTQIAHAMNLHRWSCPKAPPRRQRTTPEAKGDAKPSYQDLEAQIKVLEQRNEEIGTQMAGLAKAAADARYFEGLYKGYSEAVAALSRAVLGGKQS